MVPSVIDYLLQLPEAMHFARVQELCGDGVFFYRMLSEYGNGTFQLIEFEDDLLLILIGDYTPKDTFEKITEISEDYMEISQFETDSSSFKIGGRKKNQVDKGIYCYAGCLEGRGFDECGAKGFVLLTVDSGRIQHEFVPFSCRQLHRISVNITGLTKNSEIGQKMKETTQNISSNDMVEFLLSGEVDPTANIAVSYLQNLVKSDFFFVKVKDETHMAINPEDYKTTFR